MICVMIEISSSNLIAILYIKSQELYYYSVGLLIASFIKKEAKIYIKGPFRSTNFNNSYNM